MNKAPESEDHENIFSLRKLTSFIVITFPGRSDGLSIFENDRFEVGVGARGTISVALITLAATILRIWILIICYTRGDLKISVKNHTSLEK